MHDIIIIIIIIIIPDKIHRILLLVAVYHDRLTNKLQTSDRVCSTALAIVHLSLGKATQISKG